MTPEGDVESASCSAEGGGPRGRQHRPLALQVHRVDDAWAWLRRLPLCARVSRKQMCLKSAVFRPGRRASLGGEKPSEVLKH